MQQHLPAIFLPEGVVRASSNDSHRSRFTTLETEHRLTSESAWRQEKLAISSSHRLKRRTTDLHEVAHDAESVLQVVDMIFKQLAKQENAALCQPTAGDDTEWKEREKMRSEAMEIMRTII